MRLNPDSKTRGLAGVYEIRNEANGRCYIGGAVDLHLRFLHHRRALELGRHPNDHLQKAHRKYGSGSFIFKVLVYCSAEEVKDAERITIDERWSEGLYNICRDPRAPMRGLKFSEEHRKNLAASIRVACSSEEYRAEASERTRAAYENDPTLRSRVSEGNRRAHADPEVKRRHAEAVRYSHSLPETKKKLSAINRGRRFSEEARKRMSESAKRRRSK